VELLASITANFILYTLLILSLNNFIVGKTSIWSIGHMAFFGIGALTSGMLIIDWNISAWIALVVSLLFGLLISLVIGLTTRRLAQDYFIILSIGVCEMVRVVSINLKGPSGITGIPRPKLLGISLENDWIFIALILLPIFVAIIFLAIRFSNSPLERICSLVRQNEEVAKLLKISPIYYKIGCFCIGSSISCLTGVLYTFFSRSTDPSIITIYQSILLFAMVLFGGINSIKGSIVGGVMIVAIPRILEYFINNPLASYYSAQIIQLVYGVLLILVIRFVPQGLMGTSRNWFYTAQDQ
jgi:branched-chain amino acid transport system permease protein